MSNLIPWWEYFCFTLLEAYKQFEQRLGFVENSKGVKSATVLSCIQQFYGEFSIQEIQEACPTVGIDMIRKILRHEREEKRLECLGRGPLAKWRKVQSKNLSRYCNGLNSSSFPAGCDARSWAILNQYSPRTGIPTCGENNLEFRPLEYRDRFK